MSHLYLKRTMYWLLDYQKVQKKSTDKQNKQKFWASKLVQITPSHLEEIKIVERIISLILEEI